MVEAVNPVLEKELVVGCPTGTVVPGVTVNPVLGTSIDIIMVEIRLSILSPC